MSEQEEKQAEAPKTRDMNVVKGFNLRVDADTVLRFEPGSYKNVPLEHADHYYAKLHCLPDGEPLPSGEAKDVSQDFVAERKARLAAEDEATRLRTLMEQTNARAMSAESERDGFRFEIDGHKARVKDLEARIAELEAADESDGTESGTGSAADVVVYRRGKRWLVRQGPDQKGDFGSREEADAKAAELRAATAA